jgi:hypothetical protein
MCHHINLKQLMFCVEIESTSESVEINVETTVETNSQTTSSSSKPKRTYNKKYNKKCYECNKVPSYNIKGSPPIYCAQHKKANMIDVRNTMCIICNNTHATYNIRGHSALYCAKHKTPDMINVVTKRCLKCDKIPHFNIVGKSAQFCADHKTEEMIDVKARQCLKCSTSASFNIPGKIAQYCAKHKEDGMVDLRNKQCLKCDTLPSFNFYGNPAIVCAKHKEKGMIDVSHKQCMECTTIPCFGYVGEPAYYCSRHKKSDMIDVVNKHCLTPLCTTSVHNPVYKGYCLRCFVYNPNNMETPIYRNYKTKERNVADRVQSLFPNINWKMDKRIIGGSSNRRPDMFVDMNTYVIVVEIDEYRHSRYDPICEEKRLMEIWADIGCRSIVLIRFNPDAYTTLDGAKVSSCWGITKHGVVRVPDNKRKQWQTRIEALSQQIKHWIETTPDKSLEIIELFYR